jgi:hypothetical protein
MSRHFSVMPAPLPHSLKHVALFVILSTTSRTSISGAKCFSSSLTTHALLLTCVPSEEHRSLDNQSHPTKVKANQKTNFPVMIFPGRTNTSCASGLNLSSSDAPTLVVMSHLICLPLMLSYTPSLTASSASS